MKYKTKILTAVLITFMTITVGAEGRGNNKSNIPAFFNNTVIDAVIVVVLLLLLLLAVLSYAYQKNLEKRIRLKSKNLEQENRSLAKSVELKNHELSENVKHLLNKNKVIRDAVNSLAGLESRLKHGNKKIIREIIFDLQKSMDDESWEEFKIRFYQVNDSFYKGLRRDFPAITPAELKLAAFLKLNMTTREIAAIMQQNIKSIETSRTRLRKKLNIANKDISLFDFLSKY